MNAGVRSRPPRAIGPPTSLYVWGSDRDRLNQTARTLAGTIDPDFEWLEAVEAHGPSHGPRATPVDPRAGPGPAASAGDVPEGDSKATDAGSQGSRGRVAGRLRELPRVRPQPGLLPRPVARLLAHPPPRVLVVGNSDRLGRPEVGNPAGLGPLVDPLNWMGITLFATHQGRPDVERVGFEYSLAEVSALPRPAPKGLALVCQWGNCEHCLVRERFGPFRVACFGSVLADLRQRRSQEPERTASRDRPRVPPGRPLSLQPA